MANVFTDFKAMFLPAAAAPRRRDTELAEERQVRRDRAQQVKELAGMPGYKMLRARIEAEIEANDPDPALGPDVASCYTFKQQGLRTALKIMDNMEAVAAEDLTDAT